MVSHREMILLSRASWRNVSSFFSEEANAEAKCEIGVSSFFFEEANAKARNTGSMFGHSAIPSVQKMN